MEHISIYGVEYAAERSFVRAALFKWGGEDPEGKHLMMCSIAAASLTGRECSQHKPHPTPFPNPKEPVFVPIAAFRRLMLATTAQHISPLTTTQRS